MRTADKVGKIGEIEDVGYGRKTEIQEEKQEKRARKHRKFSQGSPPACVVLSDWAVCH